MRQVINIQHWLDEHGEPARPVRRRALRVARLIEYGGPLAVGHAQSTLVECSQRIARKPCEGLLWVVKQDEHTLEAFCDVCQRENLLITGWESTAWADGPVPAMPPDDVDLPLLN